MQITYQTPFPGTPLYARLKQQGRLLYDGAWERCTLFDVNFRPARMSAEELRQGFHDLARRLYCDDFTKFRRDAFNQQYRRRLRTHRREAIGVGAE